MKEGVKVCAIVAMAPDHAIGKGNKLLWHIPEDLKYFKRVTMGKPVIMGRKTWESIVAHLGKGLPGRDNIVISRSGFDAKEAAVVHGSPAEAIDFAVKCAKEKGLDEVFVIGGAQIYEKCLPHVDRLYLTLVEGDYEADAYFPDVDFSTWKEISVEHHQGRPSFKFIVLDAAP